MRLAACQSRLSRSNSSSVWARLVQQADDSGNSENPSVSIVTPAAGARPTESRDIQQSRETRLKPQHALPISPTPPRRSESGHQCKTI